MLLVKWVKFLHVNHKKYRDYFIMMLLAIGTLSLVIYKDEYKIKSSQFLYEEMNKEISLLIEDPKHGAMGTDGAGIEREDEAVNKNGFRVRKYEMSSPHETICIVLKEDRHNIKEQLQMLKYQSRRLLITDKDTEENYYVKIRVDVGEERALYVYPLGNTQPFFDLLVIGRDMFGMKMIFDPFRWERYPNTLEIKIRMEDLDLLRRFIVYIFNSETLVDSTYYYLPFRHFAVFVESLIPFWISVFWIMLYDCDYSVDPLLICLLGAVYCRYPIVCFLFLAPRRAALFSLLFSLLNANYGMIYTTIFYFYYICRSIGKVCHQKSVFKPFQKLFQ